VLFVNTGGLCKTFGAGGDVALPLADHRQRCCLVKLQRVARQVAPERAPDDGGGVVLADEAGAARAGEAATAARWHAAAPITAGAAASGLDADGCGCGSEFSIF
jgi:hypothetical protein